MRFFRTQHARTGGPTQHLPGIPDEDSVTVDFSRPLRRWKRRGVQVGRWFVPFEKWQETR